MSNPFVYQSQSWIGLRGLSSSLESQLEAMYGEQYVQRARQAMGITSASSSNVKDTHMADVAVVERPSTYQPEALTNDDIKEYAELAIAAKLDVNHITAERFKRFLIEQDIPVFNLQEVVKYMDAKALKESKHKNGWYWRPLRGKDHMSNSFTNYVNGGIYTDSYVRNLCPVYDKVIPKHALKKVALIEQLFGDQVKVFVSDYAASRPDPFLMAVIESSSERMKAGEGRFVIDIWDEPGFGLEAQLR